MKMTKETLSEKLILRLPQAKDGYQVNQLVAKCPQLDKNSVYCNLLQCTHFAATSVAAVINNRVVGFISAYCPPSDPKTLFVWQIVVDEMVRGHGIAKRMLNWLIDLPSCKSAFKLDATITLNNGASRALFESFARDCGANIAKTLLFDRTTHFGDKHESEYLYCVAPLPNRTAEALNFNLEEWRGQRRLHSRKSWLF